MKELVNNRSFEALISDIQIIIKRWKAYAAQSISIAMIKEHWEIGQRIVEEEQHGVSRAAYGDRLLAELSKRLTASMGKGYGDELTKKRETLKELRQAIISEVVTGKRKVI